MLAEQMNTIENMVEFVPGLLYWKNKRNLFQCGSHEFAELMGLSSKDDILGVSDFDLFPTDEAQQYQAQDTMVLQGHEKKFINISTSSKHGRIFCITHKRPLCINDQIVGVIGHTDYFTKDLYPALIVALNHIKPDPTVSNTSSFKGRSYADIYFTPREISVLSCYLRGYTAKQIASLLHLSAKTIESHIANIKIKLHCEKRSDIYDKAFEIGFIELLFHQA